MKQYRARPKTINAIQWTGDNDLDIYEHVGSTNFLNHGGGDVELWVEKSDRWCVLSTGDWIVEEPDGKGYYPIKKDIFANAYYEYKPQKYKNETERLQAAYERDLDRRAEIEQEEMWQD